MFPKFRLNSNSLFSCMNLEISSFLWTYFYIICLYFCIIGFSGVSFCFCECSNSICFMVFSSVFMCLAFLIGRDVLWLYKYSFEFLLVKPPLSPKPTFVPGLVLAMLGLIVIFGLIVFSKFYIGGKMTLFGCFSNMTDLFTLTDGARVYCPFDSSSSLSLNNNFSSMNIRIFTMTFLTWLLATNKNKVSSLNVLHTSTISSLSCHDPVWRMVFSFKMLSSCFSS